MSHVECVKCQKCAVMFNSRGTMMSIYDVSASALAVVPPLSSVFERLKSLFSAGFFPPLSLFWSCLLKTTSASKNTINFHVFSCHIPCLRADF